MDKRRHDLIGIYGKILAAFFLINLWLDVINKKLLDMAIPTEIVGYLFWLSLGAYGGFQLCVYLVFKKK